MTAVSPYLQKLAVKRAHDILEEVYPALITRGKSTEAKAKAHLVALADALETLDRLDLNSLPFKPTS